MAKLSREDVARIRAMREGGAIYYDIADTFGISYQQAQKICTHKSWVMNGPRSKTSKEVAA